jgi:hypothetical protein
MPSPAEESVTSQGPANVLGLVIGHWPYAGLRTPLQKAPAKINVRHCCVFMKQELLVTLISARAQPNTNPECLDTNAIGLAVARTTGALPE